MQVVVAANPPTLTTTTNVIGKVLALSPDGKKVIVSDIQSAVNQVFIFDTSSNTTSSFLISGATAAAFSPDNLKAYILAGTKLYVYSTQAPLKTITLPAAMTGSDVAFFGTGGFAYIAGTAGGSGQVVVRNTCDDSISLDPSTSAQQIVPTPGAPLFIRPLPGESLIMQDPPGVDIITGTVGARPGHPVPGDTGCPIPFPQGYLGITNAVSSKGLGQGLFTPVGFEVSSDGQKVYVAIQNISSIVVLDVPSGNISSIGLVGNPAPLAMSLSADGSSLYVSASDLAVHVINTSSGSDANQVSLVPTGSSAPATVLCAISTGGTPPNCLPDLIAVKP
jgi:DNA-binding beta-propeller fold protein YncE